MLTKCDVTAELEKLGLDPDRYWVTAGAALVLYDLREETADIDLGCDPSLIDELIARGCGFSVLEDGSRKIHLPPDVDLFENWGRGFVQRIEGLPTVSLYDVLLLKKKLNREKDRADIQKIEQALGLS